MTKSKGKKKAQPKANNSQSTNTTNSKEDTVLSKDEKQAPEVKTDEPQQSQINKTETPQTPTTESTKVDMSNQDGVQDKENQPKSLKQQARKQYKNGDFVASIELYTEALQADPEAPELLSNRAVCYINIGCYELALKDTEKVIEKNPSHEKCLFRKVKSLCGLNRVKDALNFLNEEVPKEILEKPDFTELKAKVEKMLKQLEGEYDLLEILKSKDKEQRHSAAEYTELIKIAPIEGKGRGILATKDIPAGQLVMCSKAYAIAFGKQELMKIIAKKLIWDKRTREDFCKLYPGPKSTLDSDWLSKQCETRPEDFLSNEPTDSNKEIREELWKRMKYNHFIGTNCRGVCILHALINHRCVDVNAFWEVYGDMIVVRSVKDIKAGDEIVCRYALPAQRYQLFENHHFTCDCRLCELERAENPETKEAIAETLKSIQENLGKSVKVEEETTLIEQFARVEKLISLRAETPDCNAHLLDKCIELVSAQFVKNEKWDLAYPIFKAKWIVCKNMGLVESSVCMDYLALKALASMKLETQEHIDLMKEWEDQLEKDVSIAYGVQMKTVEPKERNSLLNKILAKHGMFMW